MQINDDNVPEGYARVTEILSPYNDYGNIPPDVLARAADRGTRVHEYCRQYAAAWSLHAADMFDVDEVASDCMPYVMSYIGWHDHHIKHVWHQERRLNCDILRISGQLDMVATLHYDDLSVKTVIDLKTPQDVKKSWGLQLAAYQYLAEQNNITVHRRAVLQLSKTGGKATLIDYNDHKNDLKLFLGAVDLYWYFKS